jgi:hypothetical protein
MNDAIKKTASVRGLQKSPVRLWHGIVGWAKVAQAGAKNWLGQAILDTRNKFALFLGRASVVAGGYSRYGIS